MKSVQLLSPEKAFVSLCAQESLEIKLITKRHHVIGVAALDVVRALS